MWSEVMSLLPLQAKPVPVCLGASRLERSMGVSGVVRTNIKTNNTHLCVNNVVAEYTPNSKVFSNVLALKLYVDRIQSRCIYNGRWGYDMNYVGSRCCMF
jgi:hypothetical protein